MLCVLRLTSHLVRRLFDNSSGTDCALAPGGGARGFSSSGGAGRREKYHAAVTAAAARTAAIGSKLRFFSRAFLKHLQ